MSIRIFILLPAPISATLHGLSPWLLFLAAVPPAAVAGLNGIRCQAKCRRLADRSTAMKAVLSATGDEADRLSADLARHTADLERNPGAWTREALSLAEDCARVSVDEVTEWTVLYTKEVPET